MTELERWLPRLTPPAGGLQRLQQSLSAQPQSSIAWLRMPLLALTATAPVVILVMLSLMLTSPMQTSPMQAHRVAVALDSLADQPPAALDIEHGAALEVSQPGASVRVFLVMTR